MKNKKLFNLKHAFRMISFLKMNKFYTDNRLYGTNFESVKFAEIAEELPLSFVEPFIVQMGTLNYDY